MIQIAAIMTGNSDISCSGLANGGNLENVQKQNKTLRLVLVLSKIARDINFIIMMVTTKTQLKPNIKIKIS